MFPLNRLLKGFIKRGEMTVIDADGAKHHFGGVTDLGPGGERLNPVTIRLHDKSLYYKLVLNPELHAGEAYMDERVTMEEGTTIRDFLTLFSANRYSLHDQPLQRVFNRGKMLLRRTQQRNRKGKAQKNVAHHYDLGNELYKLFLDKNMVYSCGYFVKPTDSLETAQRNKMRLLAAKLNLKKGLRVLDIGSGWGDLALYLAKLEEVEVVGITLSREQLELSNARAAEMGLSNRVRFELKDYRDVSGQFDRIVSVGMFEHVGVRYYDEFFRLSKSLMPRDGVMMLHSIGHMSPPTTTSPWYRKYIFPGGYAPSLSEVLQSTERNHLWVTDLETLRLHYSLTLSHWHRRFEENRDTIIELYDERFARMWEFYLVSAELSFRTGSQFVFQLQLSSTRDAVPIVRDYLTDRQRQYIKQEKSLEMAI